MADPLDFFKSLNQPQAPVTTPAPSGPDPADFFKQFEQPKQSEGPQYGMAETALRHGAHGASFGLSDEMMGARAAASGVPEMIGPIPTRLLAGAARTGLGYLTGADPEGMAAYKKGRDEERAALEASRTQNPVTAFGSDVAGSMVGPGGALLKGAGYGARALRGALVSGVQGGARGAGEAQELENVPEGTATGAVLGAALGAPFNAVLGPRATSVAKQAVIDAANKYGVQLPHYMVSESPLVQFAGKGFDQLPFVGGAVSSAAKKAKEGIQSLRDRIVEEGSGTTIPTEARKIGSDAAHKAREEFVENARRISDENYSAVTRAMTHPNAKLTPTNMQNEVADQFHRLQQYGGNPGSVLNQAIQASEAAIDRGGLTYEGLKSLRTDLYRKWNSMEGKGGIDYADYTKLIGAITKDMEDVVYKAGGPNAVKLWEKANAQHAVGKNMGEELATAIGGKMATSDTSAADAIMRNVSATRPNIGEINTLRNTMKPAEWDKIQAATVAKMGADDAGNFSLQKFLSANDKMADAGRDAIFGHAGNPRRDAYDAILKLVGSVQNVERFANRSLTAPVAAGIGLGAQALNDFREGNYWRTPFELGGGLALAAILARPATARSATTLAKVMEKAVHEPAAWAAGKVPRAVEVAMRNYAISLANNFGLDKDKLIQQFVGPTPLWMQ